MSDGKWEMGVCEGILGKAYPKAEQLLMSRRQFSTVSQSSQPPRFNKHQDAARNGRKK